MCLKRLLIVLKIRMEKWVITDIYSKEGRLKRKLEKTDQVRHL